MTDLKAIATLDESLLEKMLWMVHLKVQAFLRMCSETNGEDLDTTMLDWEKDLMAIGQGVGGSVHGMMRLFLDVQHQWRRRFDGDGNRSEEVENKKLLWNLRHG